MIYRSKNQDMTSEVELHDEKGHSMKLHLIDDNYFPLFPVEVDAEQHVQNIKKLPLRDDDVLLVGYTKSGAHWVWEMIGMLLKRKADYSKKTREHAFMEFRTENDLAALESPRVIHTHFLFRYLPTHAQDKKTKIVYLVRNPKDTVVSSFAFIKCLKDILTYEGDFSSYLQMFLAGKVPYGSWFQYTRDWEKAIKENPNHPIYELHYEDLQKDVVGEIKKLSSFLDLPPDDELAKAIALACSLENLRKAHDEIKHDPFAKVFKESTQHGGMYRKGKVGDWKNWFTVRENETFDLVFTEQMKDLDTQVEFTLPEDE